MKHLLDFIRDLGTVFGPMAGLALVVAIGMALSALVSHHGPAHEQAIETQTRP